MTSCSRISSFGKHILLRCARTILRQRVKRQTRRYKFNPAEQALALTLGEGQRAIAIDLDIRELFDQALHLALGRGEDI
ncbi:MAG: hypothetical protein HN627_09135, partial [Opitutae bacterium]|nr:hypothetical protein [Opitutae bacterium]